MDKYDLLEAMSGIRDEYVEEASGLQADQETGQEKQKSLSGRPVSRVRRRRPGASFWAAAAAAVLCISVVLPNLSPTASSAFQDLPFLGNYFRLVTIRSYEYQSDSADAYAEESTLVTMSKNSDADQGADSPGVMAAGSIEADEAAEYEVSEEVSEDQAAGAGDADDTIKTFSGEAEEISPEDLGEAWSDFDETEPEESVNGSASSINAVLSSAQITEEIRQMEEQAVTSFEQNVSQETGYQTLRFLHRTITDTPDWYCMEVFCYTASADGFEQVNHFTINKKTGERVELEDLFYAGADYITPISEEIISQMRARMKENPEVEYWIDSEDDPESDFSRIRDDQDFYIDDEGRLVICFNELEAAPMSMGTVEFIIPDKVLAPIRIN
ncbi:Protein of unknown function [Sarcina sp. DSM 11001]|uniref:RsiV family protein n=1 Tax=Sarcina sp. DSM 11001 TaxID=1798184 RepID=UPI00088C9036|nr:RsiV family protein [Sarcina sp. DSM 11001]SDK57164.1 Protein of unknown function [Sarcina sp. DSM 11001]